MNIHALENHNLSLFGLLVSLVAQTVKNLPAMQEVWVQFLGWKFPWRRKWQPTPVSLTGESHGQRSLAGYSSWGRKDSDTTETLTPGALEDERRG